MSLIDTKSLEHLAELARIKLGGKEEEKLLTDLKKILEYFQELNAVDTSHVEPLAHGPAVAEPRLWRGVVGGANLVNVVREDELNRSNDTGKGRGAFPEEQNRFLKIPPMNL